MAAVSTGRHDFGPPDREVADQQACEKYYSPRNTEDHAQAYMVQMRPQLPGLTTSQESMEHTVSSNWEIQKPDDPPEVPKFAHTLQSIAGDMDVDLRTISQSLVASTEHLNQAPEFVRGLVHATRRLRKDLPEEGEVSETMKMKYQLAHQELEQVEVSVTNWVVNLTKQKWASKSMISAYADLLKKIQITYGTGKQLLKYDPKLFEIELRDLKKAATNLAEIHRTYAQPEHTKGMSALKAVERAIPRAAMDGTKITEETLAKFDEHQNQLYKLIKQEQVSEHGIKVAEARKAELEHILETLGEEIQRVDDFKIHLEKHDLTLMESKKGNSKDQEDVVRTLQTEQAEKLKKLADEHSTKVLSRESNFDDEQLQLKKHQQELEGAMLSTTCPISGNHIICLVDKSYSMSGARWTSLQAAFDAFKAVRSTPECADTMSIVTFNNHAVTELMNQPLRTCGARPKGPPGGGTSFSPAFKEALRCADFTPSGYRVVLVFLTDGESSRSDIEESSRILQQMHNSMKCKSGMSTFMVMLEPSPYFDRKLMEKIVEAGNGGRTIMDNAGDRVPLLMDSNTPNLPNAFRSIATTICQQEYQIKKKLEFVTAQRVQSQQRFDAAQKKTEEMFQNMREAALNEKKFWMQCKKDDAEEIQNLIEEQAVLNKKQLAECEDRRLQLQDDKDKFKAELLSLETRIAGLRKAMESTAGARNNQEEAIKKLMDTECGDELDQVAKAKQRVLENTGTTNERALSDLMRATDSYLTMRQNDQVVAAEMDGAMGLVVNFTESVVDKLERPFRLEEFPREQKADMIFDYLRRNLRLPIEQPLRRPSNFRIALQHVAEQLSDESMEEHIKAIVEEVNPSELCADSASSLKVELEERLKNKILKESKHLRGLQKQLDGLEADRKKNINKKKDLDKKIDLAEEKKRNKDDDYDEDEYDTLKDEIQDINDGLDEIKHKKADVEQEIQDELKDNHAHAFDLMKRTTDQFGAIFDQEVSDLTIKHLFLQLASIMKQIIQPMQDIIKVADDCQQAMSTLSDSSSSPENSPQSRRSMGRRALADWSEPQTNDQIVD